MKILKEKRKTVVIKDLDVPQGPSIKARWYSCDLKTLKDNVSSGAEHAAALWLSRSMKTKLKRAEQHSYRHSSACNVFSSLLLFFTKCFNVILSCLVSDK